MSRDLKTFSIFIAAVILAAGCAPHPRYLDEPGPRRFARDGPDAKYRLGRTYIGLVSYYGAEFHGKPTATGDLFDMNGFTAAHQYMPFGTILIVKNPKNDLQCRVRINDRGPFHEGRNLDLSAGAAKAIGLTDVGVAELRYKIVRLGEP